jgi:hypothetical protein
MANDPQRTRVSRVRLSRTRWSRVGAIFQPSGGVGEGDERPRAHLYRPQASLFDFLPSCRPPDARPGGEICYRHRAAAGRAVSGDCHGLLASCPRALRVCGYRKLNDSRDRRVGLHFVPGSYGSIGRIADDASDGSQCPVSMLSGHNGPSGLGRSR